MSETEAAKKTEDADKTDLLKFFYEKSREEVNFLRERQDSIFTWSSSIFIALIGALLIYDPSAEIAILSNPWGKLTASLAVIVFAVFSIVWQQRTRRWQSENGQVIGRIALYLHCFDPNYFDPEKKSPLFPARWNEPVNSMPPTFFERIKRANYVTGTLLLGALAILMIWVRG